MKKIFYIIILSIFLSNLVFSDNYTKAVGYFYDGNKKMADEYFRKAVSKKEYDGFFDLAVQINNDVVQQKNFAQGEKQKELLVLAEKYYLIAISEGDYRAAAYLGSLYDQQGKLDLAEKYYKMAVSNGDKSMIVNLGTIYEDQKKFELAEKYYKEASDNGDSLAMENLGKLYREQKKWDLSEKYLKMAVDNGSVPALNSLGVLYEAQGK